jgi:hypothetical protein
MGLLAFRTTWRSTGLALASLMMVLAPALSAAPPGPDVTVFALPDVTNYGSANGIRGYSVGTTSCNIGDAPLSWCNQTGGCGLGTTNVDHPVIAQNLYRLKNGRMDQIGASWLKHGFVSLNQSSAGCGAGTCTSPPLGGRQLGVGCTDPYTSSLNGSRPLGRKSEVNATTGAFPFPIGGGGDQSAVWNQRVAVAESDMAAAGNPGARFFVEGHYIAPDDALAGNGLNNASYREVSVSEPNFNLSLMGSTVRERAAIEAWPVIDASVELVVVDVPGSPAQRFHVARKITEVTPGALWHYEYAIHNMNSARSADALTISFVGSTVFSGVGFHDVNAHSNEPYDTTDWSNATSANSIQWQAQPFPASPQNANALRWATMYNFWFDADRPPADIEFHTLKLFTAGSPSEISFLSTNPVMFQDGFEN